MPTATITSKGQITIPVEVRKKLCLKAGDRINFFEGKNGEYTFEPKSGSITDMKGILASSPLGYVPTIEQMDEALLEAVAKDYLRSVGESRVELLNEKAS